MSKTITLAITGASGTIYGLRLLDCLVEAGCQVYLLMSSAAHAVAAHELQLQIPTQTHKLLEYVNQRTGAEANQIQVFGQQEWTAPIASGSNAAEAMVVCPCSSGAMSAIATGASNNLIERSADVMIKERRQLILVHRETPLSAIHCQNMLTLSQNQVVILPASPGFYHQPSSMDDLINFVVARVLMQLGLKQDLLQPWAEESGLN